MRYPPSFMISIALLFSASFSEAALPSPIDWKPGVAAAHGKVKNQGDVGFCWANAWTSYLEAKVILEKNKLIDLSAMYVARSHMAEEFFKTLGTINLAPLQPVPESSTLLAQAPLTILSRYRELKKDQVAFDLTKDYLIWKLQSYSSLELEGYHSDEAHAYGVVPSSIYEPTVSAFAPELPVESDGTKIKNFIARHFFNDQDINRYLQANGIDTLAKEFDSEINHTPLGRNDSFFYDGQTYTPLSFLHDYIGIQPQGIVASHKNSEFAYDINFYSVVDSIQKELENRRPVLLSFLLLDDVDHNENLFNDGVLDTDFCEEPGNCKESGSHAVMIVNSLKDQDGKVQAFIIQNSWGYQGTDENGAHSEKETDLGFNIVTLRYLREALKHQDYSFHYMMMR